MHWKLPIAGAVMICLVGAEVSAQEAEASAPSADEKARFQDLVAEGSAKFDRRDYQGAVDAFLKAYEIKKSSNILYNIAHIYEQAGKLDDALKYYQMFAEAPAVAHLARQEAVARIRTLREVRRLHATKGEAGGGSSTDQPPALVEVDGGASASTSSEPEDPSYAWTWSLATLAGVALLGSGTFALLASSSRDEMDSATNVAARRSAADSGETQVLLADVFLGVGSLAALGAVVAYTLEADPGDADEGAGGATLSLGVVPGGGSFVWSARF